MTQKINETTDAQHIKIERSGRHENVSIHIQVHQVSVISY
jgi:hypothetical protein